MTKEEVAAELVYVIPKGIDLGFFKVTWVGLYILAFVACVVGCKIYGAIKKLREPEPEPKDFSELRRERLDHWEEVREAGHAQTTLNLQALSRKELDELGADGIQAIYDNDLNSLVAEYWGGAQ